MEQHIRNILEGAATAPSGENCQPWHVVVKDNSLEIYNVPERDLSLYNVNQLGSMTAHGAFLESLKIAASAEGLEARVRLFPDASQPTLVALVDLVQADISADPLEKYLRIRATNRKLYDKAPVDAAQYVLLKTAADSVASVRTSFIDDQARIKDLSDAFSLNERLLFENRALHDFFYSHVRWTEEEDRRYKTGFFIKTLELRGPQQPAFKLLRRWGLARFAARLGVSKQIAKDNAKTYAASAVLAAFLVRQNLPEDFVHIGRAMQRFWLTSTSLGLAVQPMTGVLFFMQRLQAESGQAFASSQQALIRSSFARISSAFGAGGDTLAVVLRIGRAAAPSARSSRFSVDEIVSEE
ncbi:MAG: hypothetical protein A2722_01755 [Candidatus Doudnabacteria bacterium RIFCSPHIGHO2_01_FULL_50_11]|uniref:Nitroreductase domain-containing protein n=1 Tax=Candidatus Doudnabacteria bacterium RIFCSPHIGHO2_01_FULL_50_11 TaxID=1817828 RepID=A0A1F5PMN6_9BACT|nr:MAG: hypothetical protein A2722_01755 [Candidatus Doudnabacteria bacterium RIFCSPHIGHO2_01_FULL_50_11]HLC44683.1 hypothetical protein [Patescibacteria group bacterium]